MASRRALPSTLFVRLFDSLADGLLICDAETTEIVSVNPALVAMCDRPARALQSKRLADAGLLSQECADLILRTTRANALFGPSLVRLGTRAGDRLIGDAVAAPFEASGRKLIYIALRDVTDRELERAHDEMERKMGALAHMAGRLAHDFNNMLTAILGYCDLLLARLGPADPARRELELARQAGERGAALTQKLLVLGRRQVRRATTINLNETLLNLADSLRAAAGPAIEVEIAPGARRPLVKADPGHLEQILVQLIANSRDAMDGGGRLRIETADVDLYDRRAAAPPGQYVLLTVSDTGAGMDAETRAHLFEPFFSRRRKEPAAGLGHAMIYGMVRQNDGMVTIDSAPGMGTAVRIYLPRLAAEPDQRPEPGETAAASDPATILLVDDEEPVRVLVREILQQAGYAVLEASGPEEALRMAESNPRAVHLVLTDVVMPGMTGAQLAQRLLAWDKGIKVLYMSGHSDHPLVLGELEPSRADFIPKPFTPAALRRKVAEMLAAGS